MKSVRIWYKKEGRAKYSSHLDINRTMIRVLARTKLPIWRTEGFNPHPFVTFSLPLSLGFCGENESMDIKLLNEVAFDEIMEKMNRYLPEGITVFNVAEPKMKPGEISKAHFEIFLECDGADSCTLFEKISSFLKKEAIITQKKTKSGFKDIDLKQYISEYVLEKCDDKVRLDIKLPSGSETNINPTLILFAFEQSEGLSLFWEITRLDLYNKDGRPYR